MTILFFLGEAIEPLLFAPTNVPVSLILLNIDL